MARPVPRPPPVMTAVRPWRLLEPCEREGEGGVVGSTVRSFKSKRIQRDELIDGQMAETRLRRIGALIHANVAFRSSSLAFRLGVPAFAAHSRVVVAERQEYRPLLGGERGGRCVSRRASHSTR